MAEPQQKACPNCGYALAYIKGGVSRRTGKTFSAFYSCSNEACNYTENPPAEPQEPTPAPKPTPAPRTAPAPPVVPEEATLAELLMELRAIKAIMLRIEDAPIKKKEEEIPIIEEEDFPFPTAPPPYLPH